MQVKLLAFAQAREQLGFDERVIECEPNETPRGILHRLTPGAMGLETMRVAIDCEYRDWDAEIGSAAEIAVIPPVSGG